MSLKSTKEIITCPIHLDLMQDPVQMKCQHTFCRNCIKDWSQKSNECPICREEINLNIVDIESIKPSLIHKQLIDSYQRNIKIENKKQNKDKQINKMKISFIGNSAVGKSCIMNYLTNAPFIENYSGTIGCDVKVIDVKTNNTVSKVYLWDTAGQERFRAITRSYYRNSNGIIIVFDKTDYHSFENVRSWLDDIEKNCVYDDLIIALVGNKIDLKELEVVSTEAGQALADAYNLLYFETSAKTGENLQLLLETLVAKINSFNEISEIFNPKRSSTINLTKLTQNKNKQCPC